MGSAPHIPGEARYVGNVVSRLPTAAYPIQPRRSKTFCCASRSAEPAVLAFDDPAVQEQAKLAILIASATAGVIGLTALLARHRLVGSEDRAPRS